MKSGQLAKQYGITRDTLRHYMEKELLKPTKTRDGRYDWSEEDQKDLEQILALRDLGFSIKAIQKIKYSHDHFCSTEQQWRDNLRLVGEELADIEVLRAELDQREQGLLALKAQLEERLSKEVKKEENHARY